MNFFNNLFKESREQETDKQRAYLQVAKELIEANYSEFTAHKRKYDFRTYIYPIVLQRCKEIRNGRTSQSLSQAMGSNFWGIGGGGLLDVEKVANNVCNVLISEIMKYPDTKRSSVIEEKNSPSKNEITAIMFHGKRYNSKELYRAFNLESIEEAKKVMQILVTQGKATIENQKNLMDKSVSQDLSSSEYEASVNEKDSGIINVQSSKLTLTTLLSQIPVTSRVAGYDTVLKYLDQNNVESFYGQYTWFRIASAIVGHYETTRNNTVSAKAMITIYLDTILELTIKIEKSSDTYLSEDGTLNYLKNLRLGLQVFGISSDYDYHQAWKLASSW